MNKVTHGHGFQKTTDYHPNVPCLVAPKILKGIKIVDGVEYYKGENGRMFVKDLFDKMFKKSL